MTTTYGTIPLSANPKHTSPSEQRIEATLGIRRPWKTVFSFSSFALPTGTGAVVSRIRINLRFFRRNYIAIVLLCLIPWFPFSLLAAAIAVLWFVCFVRCGATVVIFRRLIDDWVVLMAMGVLAEVVLHLLLVLVHFSQVEEVNSTAAIMMVAAVASVVATHAALRKTEDLPSEEEEEARETFNRNGATSRPLLLLVLCSCIAKYVSKIRIL